jgi:hypothetical protein
MDNSILDTLDIYVIKRKKTPFDLLFNYKLSELNIKYTIIPLEEKIPINIYNDKNNFDEDYKLLLTIKNICDLLPIDNKSSILILEQEIIFYSKFTKKLKENFDLLDSNDIVYFGNNLQNAQENNIPFYAVLLKPEIITFIKEKIDGVLNENQNNNIQKLLWNIINEKNKKSIVLNPNLILYPKTMEILQSNIDDFSLNIFNNLDIKHFNDYTYLSSTIHWDKICKFMLGNKLSMRKMNINMDKSIDNVSISKIIENGHKSFVLIISSFNNSLYYKKNLDSVFIQKYPFWRIIYVDDCSTDNTYELVKDYIIEKDFGKKVTLIKNKKNMKQTYSRYIAYNMCQPDEICCMLDGDDWLLNEDVLSKLNNSYLNEKLLVSYGQFYYYENDKLGDLSGYYSYSDEEIQNNNYREKWISQHLRTCEASLLHTIPKNYLKFNNEWIKCCSDLAEMWWVLEKSNGRHANIGYPVYVYNKDASMTYDNSYFNKNKNIVWGLYREGVEKYLKEYKHN